MGVVTRRRLVMARNREMSNLVKDDIHLFSLSLSLFAVNPQEKNFQGNRNGCCTANQKKQKNKTKEERVPP